MGHPRVPLFINRHSQRRIPIDELSSVSQATYIYKVTNKISTRPAQAPSRRQVTLPPPSSPTRPGSPILIRSRSEGLPTAEDNASLWTGEEFINRRTSFAQHLATTAD